MQVILKKLFFYIPQLWAATPTLQALRAQTARPAQLSQAGHVGTRSSTTRHKSWDQPQEGLQELTLPHHKPTPFIPQLHCRAAHPRAHGGGCWQLPCNIHQLTNNAPKALPGVQVEQGTAAGTRFPSPFLGKAQTWAWQTLPKPLATNLSRFVQIPIPHHTQSSSALHN